MPPSGLETHDEAVEERRRWQSVAPLRVRYVEETALCRVGVEPAGVHALVLPDDVAREPVSGEPRAPPARRNDVSRPLDDDPVLVRSGHLDWDDDRQAVLPDPAKQHMRKTGCSLRGPTVVDLRAQRRVGPRRGAGDSVGSAAPYTREAPRQARSGQTIMRSTASSMATCVW
jgi:hypothetical protein